MQKIRYCSRCKCELTPENMLFRDRLHLKPRSECKNCFCQIQKEQQQKRKEKLVLLKGGGCSICGYSKFLGALEFHHLDPKQKEFRIAKIYSWAKTFTELDKCILVCSNCHKEIHYGQH